MKVSREEALFAAALDRPISQRPDFLDGACQGDDVLRSRVESLLAAHDASSNPLATQDGPTVKIELAEAPDEVVGQKMGRYKLMEKLGEGGCGVVYIAEQTEPVRRRVALKVIKPGMDTRQVVARFEAERQALAMMDHPNIAKVLDAGTTDAGRPYFVMELVRGIRITDYCDQASLSTTDRLNLFIKVCQAIQHAHQKGIIHRDIKPSNILVTMHDGMPVPKVIDFGIAKATDGRLAEATVYTQLHQFIGTPAYMSPEQAEMSGLDIDTRSDIYSLGVLLYELLAGTTPFDVKELMAGGLDAMRKTIREKEPQRPSTRFATLCADQINTTARRRSTDSAKLLNQLKGDLDWIVMKCLEKDRQRRYDTANGLAADLRRHLDNEPVVARPPSRAYRLQKMIQRNKTETAGVVGVALALGLSLGFATVGLHRERMARERERAQSIRADTVTTFIDSLVSEQLPLLMQQGNIRGVRELIGKADALASSYLSNAPGAEIKLRANLHRALGNLSDIQSSLKQAEAIDRLLPKVSEDELPARRDEIRLDVAATRLWGAATRTPAQEQAMKAMNELYAEFMSRVPPGKVLAADCRWRQSIWLTFAATKKQAQEAIEEARTLLSRAAAPVSLQLKVASTFAQLCEDSQLAEAEQLARETLAKLPPLYAGTERQDYWGLIGELINALGRQGRLTEATALLDQQVRWLNAHGGTPADQVRLDALRGAILARSGRAREALPILEAVVTSPYSGVNDWAKAAIVAVAIRDHACSERLHRACLLRFSSTAEGDAARQLLACLLEEPVDDRTLALARGLFDRINDGSFWVHQDIHLCGALLAYRERRPVDALVLLEKHTDSLRAPGLSSPAKAQPEHQAYILFTRALLCVELGRREEARHDFAKGLAQLKLSRGEQQGRDRGGGWWGSYSVEIRQREAEEVFRANNIPLPEPEKQ